MDVKEGMKDVLQPRVIACYYLKNIRSSVTNVNEGICILLLWGSITHVRSFHCKLASESAAKGLHWYYDLWNIRTRWMPKDHFFKKLRKIYPDIRALKLEERWSERET